MKKPLALTFALAASLALAAGVPGTAGRGRAATSDGRTGSFDFRATKRVAANGTTVLEGRLRFEQQPNAHGPYVLIEMGTPSVVGIAGTVAEFGGHGILTRLEHGLRVRYGGTVSVRVVDRHNPAHPNHDADAFRVRFVGEHGLTFAFEGALTDGDLAVGAI